MGFHLLCDDGLGRCMACFVYIVMFMGHATFALTVFVPMLGTEEESRATIEYISYSACWLLMFCSHVCTMCIDPGFIPYHYEYKEHVLAAPFSKLAEVENAYMNKDRVPISPKDIQSAADRSSSRLSSVHENSIRNTRGRQPRSSEGTDDIEAVVPKLHEEERKK